MLVLPVMLITVLVRVLESLQAGTNVLSFIPMLTISVLRFLVSPPVRTEVATSGTELMAVATLWAVQKCPLVGVSESARLTTVMLMLPTTLWKWPLLGKTLKLGTDLSPLSALLARLRL